MTQKINFVKFTTAADNGSILVNPALIAGVEVHDQHAVKLYMAGSSHPVYILGSEAEVLSAINGPGWKIGA